MLKYTQSSHARTTDVAHRPEAASEPSASLEMGNLTAVLSPTNDVPQDAAERSPLGGEAPALPSGTYGSSTQGPMLYTFKEAMAYLRVSRSTLLRMLSAGALVGHKVGYSWRFFRCDLDACIHRVSPGHSLEDGVSHCDQPSGKVGVLR